MERKLVLNFFGKNPSILKKFLFINFIVFLIIGILTLVYLDNLQPSLTKDKTTKHIKAIDNTIKHLNILKDENFEIEFNEKDINGFKKILYAMIEEENKKKYDEINKL